MYTSWNTNKKKTFSPTYFIPKKIKVLCNLFAFFLLLVLALLLERVLSSYLVSSFVVILFPLFVCFPSVLINFHLWGYVLCLSEVCFILFIIFSNLGWWFSFPLLSSKAKCWFFDISSETTRMFGLETLHSR